MSASFLPPIFISLIGLVFPFITLGSFFAFIEKDIIE
jgi:photosystem I reaction center subunit VIII